MKVNLIFFLLFIPLFLFSEILAVQQAGYTVDIPAEWFIQDDTDPAKKVFFSSDYLSVLQVFIYDKEKYSKAALFYEDIKKQLKGTGEGEPFNYLSMESYFADLTFSAGKFDVRGYFVFINGAIYDYAVSCYTHTDYYNERHNLLISALDSFSLDTGRLAPGPVSQFFSSTGKNKAQTYSLVIGDQKLDINVSNSEIEASQVLIEREASLLAAYSTVNINAWQRFYRMLYRDNYMYIQLVSQLLKKQWKSLGKKEIIKKLVTWIQDFDYSRTDTLSDFLSPLSAMLSCSGDCDSRVLVLLLLFHQLDIDAVLMVSNYYKHSAIGINTADYPAKGAVLKYNNKNYIYTELTEKADIGKIPVKVAELDKWIVMKLP